jgi:Ca-activated chloride channel family protein
MHFNGETNNMESTKSFRVIQLGLTPTMLLCASAALALSSARAQNVFDETRGTSIPGWTNVNENVYKIRVTSDLVQIPVTVVDRHGKFIPGLEGGHFKVFEDNKEQAITHFAMDDAPVTIGFVFDTSASMVGRVRQSHEAVATFLKTANRDDEFFLVQFNSRVHLTLGMTQRTAGLQRSLMATRPRGATSLLDAVYFSIGEMKNAHNARKALIIVSDGGDNASHHTLNELMYAIRETDIQVYAVGIFEPSNVRSRSVEEAGGPSLLKQITEETAGQLFEVDDLKKLTQIASKISLGLRKQYVLGYMPWEPKHDGKYHRVQVTLQLPKSFPTLRVSWRQGYYAPNDLPGKQQ